MTELQVLAGDIVSGVADSEISADDREFLISLIVDLLGDRKRWYVGIRDRLVTREEVALGMLSHIFTVKDGYFTTGNRVNFDEPRLIEKVLASIT